MGLPLEGREIVSLVNPTLCGDIRSDELRQSAFKSGPLLGIKRYLRPIDSLAHICFDSRWRRDALPIQGAEEFLIHFRLIGGAGMGGPAIQ